MFRLTVLIPILCCLSCGCRQSCVVEQSRARAAISLASDPMAMPLTSQGRPAGHFQFRPIEPIDHSTATGSPVAPEGVAQQLPITNGNDCPDGKCPLVQPVKDAQGRVVLKKLGDLQVYQTSDGKWHLNDGRYKVSQ